MSPPRQPQSLRDPSQVVFQADGVRRSILVAYWAVIILAIPLWWHTTSIERLSLPRARVFAQAEREPSFPVTINVEPVFTPSRGSVSVANDLELLLNDKATQFPERWKGVDVSVVSKQSDDAILIKPLFEDSPDTPGFYAVVAGERTVQDRVLSFPIGDSELLPLLADMISDLLVPYTPSSDQVYRVAQYAPRYRLAFTLLNEDAAEGGSALSWDIAGAISEHISPILKKLSILHNFTIESQVQIHAPLAFDPQQLTHLQEPAFGLTPEDLTVFVNSAEWTLSSSVSNDPVLHFVLFIPSPSRRPLHILDKYGVPSESNAFLLPQWGGIVIFNLPATSDCVFLGLTHLNPVFSAFSNQLLALLGVPRLPPNVQTSNSSSIMSGWQFDALVRRRVLENTHGSQDTLKSIVQLVDQIENMPVKQDVKGDILDALFFLDKLYTSAPSPTLALRYSSEALSLSSRAFFNPGMLALLYFPVEHKYAVYAPMFASAMIPLIAAAMREIAAERRARNKPVAGGREKVE